jgi:hypothetical protein
MVYNINKSCGRSLLEAKEYSPRVFRIDQSGRQRAENSKNTEHSRASANTEHNVAFQGKEVEIISFNI